jgi:spore germination protein YaaH
MITGAYLAPPAQADPAVQPIVTGWLPYWFTTPAKPQGINAAVANADLFTEVSPFWYSATVGGSNGIQILLNPNFTNGAANEAWAMGQLRAAGLKVLPSIADGTGKGRMAALLADSTRRAAHVQEVVNLVTSKGYDGIDLDYEGFAFNDGRDSWAATQPLWRAFITELADALHAQGKLLAVTIPPPCSMSGQCGPTSGYWVYDFANIAQQADRVRIMAYDYSVAGVGPIAPMPWVQAIVAYAAGAAPAQRVQIGVPTYGRAWTKKVGGKFQLSGTCPSSGKAYQSLTSMVSVTDAEIPGALAAAGVPEGAIQWDAVNQESFVEYDKPVTWTDDAGAAQTCVARRIMYWVGPQAVLARTQLVGAYGIGGAAYWTIGGEDPAQWSLIRTYAQQLAPAATDVAVAVPQTAAVGEQLMVAAQVTSNGAAVSGVPATLQFAPVPQGDWADVATVATGPDGTVAFPVTVRRPGQWRVSVPAGPGRAEQVSDPVTMAVSATVRTVVKTPTARPRSTGKVRVVVDPGQRWYRIRLEQSKGERWRVIQRGRTDRKGVDLLTFTAPRAKGTYTYRVVVEATGPYAESTSAPFNLRVRKSG